MRCVLHLIEDGGESSCLCRGESSEADRPPGLIVTRLARSDAGATVVSDDSAGRACCFVDLLDLRCLLPDVLTSGETLERLVDFLLHLLRRLRLLHLDLRCLLPDVLTSGETLERLVDFLLHLLHLLRLLHLDLRRLLPDVLTSGETLEGIDDRTFFRGELVGLEPGYENVHIDLRFLHQRRGMRDGRRSYHSPLLLCVGERIQSGAHAGGHDSLSVVECVAEN